MELMPVDASRVSRCVEKMVNMELISRRRLRNDRRFVRLELTDTGAELTLDLIAKVEARQSALLSNVTGGEMDGFIATSRKIATAFAAEEAARPPRGPRPVY